MVIVSWRRVSARAPPSVADCFNRHLVSRQFCEDTPSCPRMDGEESVVTVSARLAATFTLRLAAVMLVTEAGGPMKAHPYFTAP